MGVGHRIGRLNPQDAPASPPLLPHSTLWSGHIVGYLLCVSHHHLYAFRGFSDPQIPGCHVSPAAVG